MPAAAPVPGHTLAPTTGGKAFGFARAGLALVAVALVGGGAAAQSGAVRERVGDAVFEVLAERGEARVAVVYSGPPGADRAASIAAGAPAGHFRVRHRMRRIAAMSGSVTARGLAALLRDPRVRRVDLEEGGGGRLAEVVPLVGLDAVQSLGFDGSGITVAVLDTGADLDHDDLADAIVGEACFCLGCCPGGGDTQLGPGSAEDDHGHGTHVAGVITSNGTLSSPGGAPGADLVLVKVLDSSNAFCCASDVIAGLDWIAAERPDVDVVNMSLGTNSLYAGSCDEATASTMAFRDAVDLLRAEGVLLLAASGNEGSPIGMPAPACLSSTIAVAASDDLDAVLSSANTNATTDLVAPGMNVVSTGPANGTLSLTGTSQAAALASACAAALLGAAPSAPVLDVESALTSSTTALVDPKNGLALPRLDCFGALVALPEPRLRELAASALLLLALLRRRAGGRA